MKNIYQNIFVFIVTSFLSLILNFSVQYFAQDKGSILIGPTITSHGQIYLPISISNFTDQPIDNLILSTPVSMTISSIATSTAVQIDELTSTIGTSPKKQIRLSGIEPSRVTKLLIPIATYADAEDIVLINARQVRLTVEPAQGLQNPLFIAFQKILLVSITSMIIYGVIYGVFILWAIGQFKELNKDIESLRAEVNDAGKKLEDARSEAENVKTIYIPEIQKGLRKTNILTVARLSEYARELDFWRDTVRKVMYETTHDSNVAEKIIRQVAENLKTYSTLNKLPPSVDFESLQILAGYLQENKQD